MLQDLRNARMEPIGFDGSRPLFRVGGYPRVSELLQALPMIKAAPVFAQAPSASNAAFTMIVGLARVDGAVPTATYYDSGNDITASLTNGQTGNSVNVARLGVRFIVPRLDAEAAAANTAGDGPQWRAYAAATGVLQRLDTAIARDAGTNPPAAPQIVGPPSLATGRTAATSGNVETDAREALSRVNPTGLGAGEGPHCLATGRIGLKRLMASTSGQTGRSGWYPDARTGLNIYHYQGIPVYRLDVNEQATTRLYALNLGGTGLNLVYTSGSVETYGLVCDEDPLSSTRAQMEFVVHGAYGLVMWEPEALYEITGIALTPV